MKAGNIIRIATIVLILGVLGFGVVAANRKTPNSEKVWDERMTMGSMDAENYFVTYTDLMCPYCVAFEVAILNNEDEFKQYLEENDVLFEVKLSDFLYEYGEARPINSRYSAEATLCARNEGRFWDYYKIAIATVWNNFFATYGKSAFPMINSLDKAFWIDLGHQIGLSGDFDACVNEDETLAEVIENARKTVDAANGGLPYFKFNKYELSGFDPSWDWSYVKKYFDMGLRNK